MLTRSLSWLCLFIAIAATAAPLPIVFSDTTMLQLGAVRQPEWRRYTLDGSSVTAGSTAYCGPLYLAESADVRTAVFDATGKTKQAEFSVRCLRSPQVAVDELEPGLRTAYYSGMSGSFADMEKSAPAATIPAQQTILDPAWLDKDCGCRFSGYIRITEAGNYTFALNFGKMAVRLAGGVVVADPKAPGVWFEPGIYPIDIYSWHAATDGAITADIEGPGILRQPIPAAMLWRAKNPASAPRQLPRPAAAVINVDYSDAPDVAVWALEAQALCQQWYPRIAALLPGDTALPRQVLLTFEDKKKGVADTRGNRIAIAADWIRSHPEDYGMVVHELTHVIQHYPGSGPGWLVEGIADYIRFFQFEQPAARPHPDRSKTKPTDGYRTSAAFLNWLETTHGPGIVAKLNATLRQHSVTDDDWLTITGQSLDALTAEYRANATSEHR